MAYRKDFDDLSLLYPPGVSRPARRLVNAIDNTYNLKDLGIRPLVRALSISVAYEARIEEILRTPLQDASIIHYRQDVIDDLLSSPDVIERLDEVLQVILNLENYLVQPDWEESVLQRVAWRLGELENYTEAVMKLNDILTQAHKRLRSAALINLYERVKAMVEDETFIRLRADLPELMAQFRGIGSITIGVNLDSQLNPKEAMLLSVNTERFRGKSMLGWFFNRRKDESAADEPVGRIHRASSGGGSMQARISAQSGAILTPLFEDLENLMEDICKPIAKTLETYTGVSTRVLVNLKAEIAFYMGAVRLIQHFKDSGMPVCRPEVLPMQDRACELTDFYNPVLVLQQSRMGRAVNLARMIITNDMRFDDDGRIFILTGPNRGGKTTYTVALGLAQMMFQAGLYVPAASARMSPVDGIYTHFAAAENPTLETGRLGEESMRLSRVFEFATRHSLILLNESFASTSAIESLHLTRDVVRVMRLMGVRCVFATHLHELASEVDNINAGIDGDSKLISMVSLVDLDEEDPEERAKRTYRIVPGPPIGLSYAREIAARYGISYTRLIAQLQKREVLPPSIESEAKTE